MPGRVTIAACVWLAALCVAGIPTPVGAEAFYAKDEALELAFPGTADVQSRTVILTDAQAATVKERSGADLDSRLFTFYTARRNGSIVGYAVIDTHTVRTLPETFLAVLTPEGTVEQVILLAFYEPKEYMPPPQWLDQFEGRGLAGSWRVGRDLHGISGASLTARAIPEALRKILALYDVAIRPDHAAPP
jgi:hypothetical protein